MRWLSIGLAVGLAAAAAADDPVTKTYDLTRLHRKPAPTRRVLLGFADRLRAESLDDDEFADEGTLRAVDLGSVLALAGLGEEELEIDEGRLHHYRVVASAAAQRRVAYLIWKLEQALVAPLAFELSVVRLEDSALRALAAKPALTAADLAALPAARRVWRQLLVAPPGVAGVALSAEVQRFGATVRHGRVTRQGLLRVGLGVELTPHWVGDGLRLDVLLRRLHERSRRRFDAGPCQVDLPRLEGDTIASTALIPLQGAALLAAWREGGGARALLVRHLPRNRPIEALPELRRPPPAGDGKPQPFTLLDLRGLDRPLPGWRSRLTVEGYGLVEREQREPLPELLELVEGNAAWGEAAGSCRRLGGDALLFAHPKPAARAAIARWLVSQLQRPRDGWARLRLLRGERLRERLGDALGAPAERFEATLAKTAEVEVDQLLRGVLGQPLRSERRVVRRYVGSFDYRERHNDYVPELETTDAGVAFELTLQPLGERLRASLELVRCPPRPLRTVRDAAGRQRQQVDQATLRSRHALRLAHGGRQLIELEGGGAVLVEAWAGAKR